MCVVAYEACMRGIDISVDENDWSSPIVSLLAKRPEIAYIDKQTGTHPKPLTRKIADASEALEFLKSNIKSGGRYEFVSKLCIQDGFSHILCIEKIKEGFRIIEPQNGTMSKTQVEVIQYLNLIDYSYPLTLLRVDNVDFTPQFLDFIRSKTDNV